MTNKKTEVGRLAVKQRQSKPVLIQLHHSEHVFNLSRVQLSSAVSIALDQDPQKLDGTEVQFEPRNGQPWNIEFVGTLKVPAAYISTNVPRIDHELSDSNLEIGMVRYFRYDHGFITAEMDGRDDIRFYQDALVDQRWRPNEGDTVTFLRHDNRKGPVARKVDRLEACTNPEIIEYCGASERPTLWKPVAIRYLQSLPPEEQRRWILSRERYFSAGLNIEWWRHVNPEVLSLPVVLRLLPSNVATAVVSSALPQIAILELSAQATWLSQRKQFLPSLNGSAWASISAEVLWSSSCWDLLPLSVRANVLTKVQTRIDAFELLCKLDDQLLSVLDQDFVKPFLKRIVSSTDPEVERHPSTWSFLARYAHSLAALPPESLAKSTTLAASICIHPEIEAHLPETASAGGGLIKAIGPYARFASQRHVDLSGTTTFSSLEPEDLLLAATYFAASDDGRANCLKLFDGRHTREQWTWESIYSTIEIGDEDTSRAWSSFLVRGLQPRIAEIAFGNVHSALRLGEDLIDLNRHALKGLKNWTVNSVRNAFLDAGNSVHEDWKDEHRRYDVKCNLYFRSKEDRIGLRGLLIDVAAELAVSDKVWFPGFIFYASSHHDCSWSYVGLYYPKSVPTCNRSGRVAPFYFVMPETHRAQDSTHLLQVDAYRLSGFISSVWSNHSSAGRTNKVCHPLIPLLHIEDSVELNYLSKPQALLARSVAKAIKKLQSKSQVRVPTERILWVALNFLVFDARNAGESGETVALALKEACELVENPWLPVVAAKAGNTTLLELWIRQVLSVLNNHWSSIRCPQCAGSGQKLKVEPLASSAELSIWGSICCTCGFSADDVTLFTHCHECGSYPLVIGLSPICSECHGLRCHVEKDGGKCDTCKRTCTRVIRGPAGNAGIRT